MSVCSSCGSPLDPGARICGKCLTVVGAGARAGGGKAENKAKGVGPPSPPNPGRGERLGLIKNIRSSLGYARGLRRSLGTGRYFLLAILGLIPIINLVTSGYSARIMKEPRRSSGPPPLENYGALFMDGLRLLVAAILYEVVPIIVLGAAIAWMAVGLVAGILSGDLGVVMAAVTGGLSFIMASVVLMIVLGFFLPIGIVHMLRTGSLGKAFALREISRIIKRIGVWRYVGWLFLAGLVDALILIPILALDMVYTFAGSSILPPDLALPLGIVPLGSIIVGLLAGPFFQVFYARSLGQIYTDGEPGGPSPVGAESSPAASEFLEDRAAALLEVLGAKDLEVVDRDDSRVIYRVIGPSGKPSLALFDYRANMVVDAGAVKGFVGLVEGGQAGPDIKKGLYVTDGYFAPECKGTAAITLVSGKRMDGLLKTRSAEAAPEPPTSTDAQGQN